MKNTLAHPLISAFVFFQLCLLSASSFALFGPSCKHVKASPPPKWVTQEFSYKVAGWRHGFGHAVYQKKQSYDQQLANAENLARADLIKSLQVQVESELDIQTQETTRNRSVNYKQDIVQRINTRSKLELPGLAIKEKWQNANSCDLYVLVEISERVAKLVSEKAIAESYFEQGKDKRFDVKTRLILLENAIEIAKKYEFSELPNSQPSEHFIEEVQAQKELLENQLASKRNAVYLTNTQENSSLQAELIEKLAESVPGSFSGGRCNTSTQCIAASIQTPALYATIFEYSFDTKKERGFYVGEFSLNISIWDLRKSKIIYNSDTSPTIKSVNVMSRQKHGLSVKSGLKKWQRANPPALTDLKQYYQD